MESPQMLNTGTSVPKSLLMTTRIIWAGIVMGQLGFAGVIVFLQRQGSLHATAIPLNIMIPTDAMLLLFGIVMIVVGPKLFKVSTDDDAALRQQYGTRNLVPLACLDAASIFGLVMVMLTTHWWPAGIVPGISIVLQLVRFPRAILHLS